MNIKHSILTVFIIFSLAGCGTPIHEKLPEESAAKPNAVKRKAGKASVNKHDQLKKKLYSQYDEWKGVRYKLGGLNKKGVDCSGFVFLTFKTRFGKRLPRTTKRQSRLGKSVKKEHLQTGDLVFFKTSVSVRHVGIYIEDGKFIHASKKRGVMISRLNNPFWSSKYWKARRVEF